MKRVVVGQDMEPIVNPRGTIVLAEGGAHTGLGDKLYEDLPGRWSEVKAFANAIVEACGARVFRLPVTPPRMIQALKW